MNRHAEIAGARGSIEYGAVIFYVDLLAPHPIVPRIALTAAIRSYFYAVLGAEPIPPLIAGEEPRAAAIQTKRLLALDGLRGVAVLLVLLDHASDAQMRFYHNADLNRAGHFGVYLFFVLSAFLLTRQMSLCDPDQLVQARTWVYYAVRRVLRIFPLYGVVLLAYFAMHKLRASDLAPHLLLQEGTGQFWTIPVEVKYYTLLPFLVIAVFWAGRKSWAAAMGGALCAGCVAGALFGFELWWSTNGSVLLLPAIAPFIIGSAGALLSGYLTRTPMVSARFAGCLEIAGTAALVTILTRIPALHLYLYGNKSTVGKAFDPLLCGLLWMLLLLCILHGRGYWNCVMQWLPLRFLGLISFSAYLWHKKFLNDVDDVPLPTLGRLLVYLGLVVLVATASYLTMERPLSQLARNWTKRGNSHLQ